MKLSVCLIVRDEERVLARCLTCAKKFADEIVVCDTGSTDGTLNIAKEYADKVVNFKWCDDFSAARNFCFDAASGDYVMWLDADDIVEDGEIDNILRIKSQMGDFDMAFLRYGAKDNSGALTFVCLRERIFKNSPEYRFFGAVHEAVVPRGKIIRSDALILHKKEGRGDGMRNLKIYQKRIYGGISLTPREKFYYGRELMFCGMPREAETVLCDFLRGDGWVENKIEALYNLYQIRSSLGDSEGAARAVFFSFTLSPPRPYGLCAAGDIAFLRANFKAAEFWYNLALSADCGEGEGAFVNPDYSRFIPYMRLCAVRDRLGDYKKACEYNELAALERPDDSRVAYNREYFKTKLKEVKNES